MPANLAHVSGETGTETGGHGRHPASLNRLIAARRRVDTLTIVIVMATYIGFFALVALAPDALGAAVSGFGSIAFVVMAAMFAVAWIITWSYLRHASRRIAPLEQAARETLRTGSDSTHQETAQK
ncbi:DUF485 domain-containing protein [Paraburkholderia caballeronis]|uniref:DUF485 domain-containing protein n=1 Tax=Paraburkholderia caballeronis TaxID=416943 RepID=UPI001064A6BB|nr:DUF485 domain-containing protein [Paraburkholderia caballeronis]TDV15658.1 uncharacterized membrane protein (DUF485 family) [Paraburkholderia caballeronis]TDV17913.1 uncharacterized membrane protein (DUF485 family) [Paraburkholderia caballeronis]TDV26473.1 uncharacterized membrane protein (DUF485 family) [Paraburkholderia caballeronis]TDV33640.1 uncharacterized membrane protein (DUF485 family) [Paraburkholderia caballeronis]